jgi:hypothetical protein
MQERTCVPSELELDVAIESPKTNLVSNENATDYSKRSFKRIDTTHYLQLSERL